MLWVSLFLFLWPVVLFWARWPHNIPLPLWCFGGGVLFSAWSQPWWQEVGGVFGLLAMVHALWNVPWITNGKHVKPLALSFVLQVFTVWLVSLLGYFWLAPEASTPLISLARATYVGGTPVMAIASESGNLDPNIFTYMYLADIAASAVYLPVMWWLARQWREPSFVSDDSKWGKVPAGRFWMGIGLVFTLCTGSVWLLYGRFDPLAMVISHLVAALLLKLAIPDLRKSQSNDRPAEYGFGILFFSLGGSLDFSTLTAMPLGVWAFAFTVLFGGSLLHWLLCKTLRIHRAAWAAVSMGNNMSPPFVPSLLRLMGREDLIHMSTALSGLGFAVGLALALWTLA